MKQQNLQKFLEKFKFSQILLGDKNATSLCSKNISTLPNLMKPLMYINTFDNFDYLMSTTQNPNQYIYCIQVSGSTWTSRESMDFFQKPSRICSPVTNIVHVDMLGRLGLAGMVH